MTGEDRADRSGEGSKESFAGDYIWGAKNEAKQVSEEWDAWGPQGSLPSSLNPKPLDLWNT